MNLIGENVFITDQYIIPKSTPCFKMDCHSETARYLEVLGNRIFMKSLGDSKGTKTSNVIHLLSSKSGLVDVYIIGITYSVDFSFQGQV